MALKEQSRMLVSGEVGMRYPGLAEAMRRAAAVTSEHFRDLRSDLNDALPPLLLCDTDLLYQRIDAANRRSRYEKLNQRQYAAFQPLERVIYGAASDIQAALHEGKKGQERIVLVMAEEYTHAFSTVNTGDTTRCGFITIPHPAQRHDLFPGLIYKYELTPVFREPAFKDAVQERLTENTTRLAIHLMLEQLLSGLEESYPLITIDTGEESSLILTDKNRDLLQAVLTALFTGNRDILKRQLNGYLLPALESPHCGIASIADVIRGKEANPYIIGV